MSQNTCLHPGGLALTDGLIQMRPLPLGAKILDIGSGCGVTVAHFRSQYHYSAIGLEKDPEKACQSPYTLLADAESIPLQSNTLDAVFFECSLSKIQHPTIALAEAFRLLKPGGAIYLSDLYAQGQAQTFTGLLGRIETLPAIKSYFYELGFSPFSHQDCPNELSSYWAKLLFDNGPQLTGLLPSPQALKQVKCGYFAAVWVKPQPASPPAYAPPTPLDGWIHSLFQQGGSGVAEPPQNWQAAQIRAALAYAKNNSPFYKKHLAAFTPEEVKHTSSLASFPFTSGEDLAEFGSQMLCTSLGDVSRIHTLPTSGSTGKPKRVWFTDPDLQRTIDFFAVGMQQVAGNSKKAAILMSDNKPGSIATLLQQALKQIGVESTILGTLQSQPHFSTNTLKDVECLVGLPCDLLYLCRTLPRLRPYSVLLSADYIPDTVIETLQTIWQCKVFCHYGMTETGYGLAVQCLAGQGQHLRSADFYIEIVHPETGTVLPEGEEGEIVLTSLRDQALPLFRYKTGDWGCLIPGACPCGSTLPRLGKIKGRIANLYAPYNIHWLDEIVFADPAVLAYRSIVQNKSMVLQVEGGPLSSNTVAIATAAMGCPISVVYQPVCFTAPAGKRRIECNSTTNGGFNG